jgi:hypothetical protein
LRKWLVTQRKGRERVTKTKVKYNWGKMEPRRDNWNCLYPENGNYAITKLLTVFSLLFCLHVTATSPTTKGRGGGSILLFLPLLLHISHLPGFDHFSPEDGSSMSS